MTKQYLVRADLAFGFLKDVPISTDLPVNLGPFQLDYSPNADLYLADLGLIQPDQAGPRQPDALFPMSYLYVESEVTNADEHRTASQQADNTLERLERLLRLFQPGEVSIRRHDVWHVQEDCGLVPAWSLSAYDFRPVKSPIEGLHEYGDYPLDDATLRSLINFVGRFWHVLNKMPKNLQIAMARFSSSYEKRDLADRLVDLVIALESLFGDGKGGDITYKLAMRGAYWLYESRNERRVALANIKKLYDYRSKIVHGSLGKELTDQQVSELECMVRLGLRKFLDWKVRHGSVPSGGEIDELIMMGRSEEYPSVQGNRI